MKQFILIICLGVAMASCNNAATKESGSDSTANKTTTTTEPTLPFKLEKPYKNWQMGSTPPWVLLKLLLIKIMPQ